MSTEGLPRIVVTIPASSVPAPNGILLHGTGQTVPLAQMESFSTPWNVNTSAQCVRHQYRNFSDQPAPFTVTIPCIPTNTEVERIETFTGPIRHTLSKVLAGRLYFREVAQENSLNLWSSDGTTSATHKLIGEENRAAVIGELNGLVYIKWGPHQIGRTDGTPEGTDSTFYHNTNPDNHTNMQSPIIGTNALYFTEGIRTLVKLSPSGEKTTLINAAHPNAADRGPSPSWIAGEVSNRIVFYPFASTIRPPNNCGLASFPGGREPWSISVNGGCPMLMDDVNDGPGESVVGNQKAPIVNARMLLLATGNSEGTEFWVTDGSSISLLKDIVPGPDGTLFHTSNSMVILVPEVTGRTQELAVFREFVSGDIWITDATSAGTQRVQEGSHGPTVANAPPLVRIGNTVYFAASDTSLGRMTVTEDSIDIATVPTPGRITKIVSVGSLIVFTTTTTSEVPEHDRVWRSDGMVISEVPIQWDPERNPVSLVPYGLEGKLLLFASDSTEDSAVTELWSLDI